MFALALVCLLPCRAGLPLHRLDHAAVLRFQHGPWLRDMLLGAQRQLCVSPVPSSTLSCSTRFERSLRAGSVAEADAAFPCCMMRSQPWHFGRTRKWKPRPHRLIGD